MAGLIARRPFPEDWSGSRTRCRTGESDSSSRKPPARRPACARAREAAADRRSWHPGRRGRSARLAAPALWIWMEGETGGVEQPGCYQSGTPSRQRGGRTAAQRRGVPGERVQTPVHAVEGPNELQGNHPREVAGKPRTGLPARRNLADQDRVMGMSGRLQGRPGRVEQRAVRGRRRLDARVVDRLRAKLLAVVRLVPDRPEMHRGQRRGGSGWRVVAAVAGADRGDEQPELLRRRLPRAQEAGRGPGGHSGAGRPQRRRRLECQVEADVAGGRIPDDRVVWSPAPGRVALRRRGVEVRSHS